MIGNPLKVEDVISELRRGGIRIPEIQRNYVWKRGQIAKLLDSLYREFPTGSVLLWDTQEPLITRDLNTGLGAGVRADFVPKVVLDGQQRITSLGRVFDPETPKPDRILFNVIEEEFEPHSPRTAADPRWIDVTGFFTSEESELDILDRLVDRRVIEPGDREGRNAVHERLKRLKGIRAYQYPVEIVREDDLEVVTEIFIRVNSGGTRLREAELALARLAWKIPGSIVGPFEQMEDDCRERGFDLDTRFLMKSLIAMATGQARFKDLKTFWERPVAEIQRAWDRAAKGLTLALDFVEGNIGIPGSDFLPSQASLIPVAYVFAHRDRLSGDEQSALRRWFLIANTFSRYVGATDTKLNQDLTALGMGAKNIAGLLEHTLKNLRAEPRLTESDLQRASVNSPFFPLAYLAAIQHDAADWFRGIKLRRDSFTEDQAIEYHHIFPKKHSNARNVDRYQRDELANLAFLTMKANRSILAKKPSEYLAEIADEAPERLEAQFVPMDSELWELDRFDDFLAERRKLLVAAMNDILDGRAGVRARTEQRFGRRKKASGE